MSCKGLHCGGCRDGGGGGFVVVVIVALVAHRRYRYGAVSGAANTAVHVVTDVLEVVAISLASLAAVAVAAALTWTGVRVYRWDARRRARAVPAVVQVPVQATVRAEVIPHGMQAIEAPKPRLDAEAVSGLRARSEP